MSREDNKKAVKPGSAEKTNTGFLGFKNVSMFTSIYTNRKYLARSAHNLLKSASFRKCADYDKTSN